MRSFRIDKITVLSVSHAAVDFCCAALFFGMDRGENAWLCMVFYNACAFLMQLPLGFFADRLNRNLPFASIGCLLVAAACLLRANPLLAVIVAGLGNGAFHVGGGIEVLNDSGDKAGPLGVFVSPGAIGLFLGRVYADFFAAHILLLPALMLLCGAAMVLIGHAERRCASENADFSLALPKSGAPLLVLLFLVVVLRSFMGTTAAFSTGTLLNGLHPTLKGLIPVLCLAGGKAAGGFVADRLKPIPTAIASLGLCALLLFFPLHPAFALIALFLFNMSMPITLFGSARLLKGAKGGAFGLLTAALFLGTVPVFLGISLPALPWLHGVFAVVSLVLLVIGLRNPRWNT